jgi:hypothetical protein
MSDDEQARREADSRTLSALLLVVVVASLILGLIAMILPAVLGIVLIVGGMAWFGFLHYLLWGWWLGSYLKRMDEGERNDDSAV